MKKAIYFTKTGQLRNFEAFDRVYFGNEFCRFLIPRKKDLKNCISEIGNRALTLTTPIIDDFDFSRLKALFDILERERPGSEVVFNDLGVLEMLKDYRTLSPVFGRLLFNHIFIVSDKVRVNDLYLLNLLKRYNVGRVEISNYEKPIVNKPQIPISLHIPYAHMTTTRLCSSNPEKHLNKNKRCNLKCATTNIKYPSIKDGVILKGNTEFIEKRTLLKQNAENIDRLVISREVPL